MLVAGDSHWRGQVDGCSAAAPAVPRYCVAGSFSLIIIGGILGVIRNNNNNDSYGRWAWRDRNNFSELIHCCISQRREEEEEEGNKERRNYLLETVDSSEDP